MNTAHSPFTITTPARMSHRPCLRVIAALSLILSIALSGCSASSSAAVAPAAVTPSAATPEASPVPPLSAADTNLIFIVTPDLAHNNGDINPTTANLTTQGLQRALYLAPWLHTNLLGSANASGIYALEPATRLQTPLKTPDLVPLEIIEQFALLNKYSENVAKPPLVLNVTGDSFPVNVSYSPASVPPGAAVPQGYPPNCQGIDFADHGGNNEALVNGIIAQKKGGFYVFALPFETLQSLLAGVKSLNSYGYDIPGTWEGPNTLYVLAVSPTGQAALAPYNTHITPGTTYPVLSPAWQNSPSSYQAPFVIQPEKQAGYSLPATINVNETIHFIRHAEAHPTSEWDDGNLVMRGNWRALYLPAALAGKIAPPDLVYAVDPAQLIPGSPESGNPSVTIYSYTRTSQTAAPYAIAHGIPFHVASGFTCGVKSDDPNVIAAANFFFTGGQFSNKTLLVAWEHNNIPWIGQALVNLYFADPSNASAVPPNTSWPGDDYDTIWTFTLDDSGNLTLSNTTCEGINSATLPSTPPSF